MIFGSGLFHSCVYAQNAMLEDMQSLQHQLTHFIADHGLPAATLPPAALLLEHGRNDIHYVSMILSAHLEHLVGEASCLHSFLLEHIGRPPAEDGLVHVQ